MQRTRCYYFYDTATPCNKREPGTGCSAIKGLNRIHAILGASEACIATHPSDMCVALAALEATVHVTGPAGERAIAFADFHRLPGNTPQQRHEPSPGRDRHGGGTAREGLRQELYLPEDPRPPVLRVCACVCRRRGLELEAGVIKEARLALGGVAHKPWRDAAAKSALRGEVPNRSRIRPAADLMLRDAKGLEHNAFKIDLARRVIVRALTQAAQGTPQSQSHKKIR